MAAVARCCSTAARSTPTAVRVARSPEARRRVVRKAARRRVAGNRAERTPGRCARVVRTRVAHGQAVRTPGTGGLAVRTPGTPALDGYWSGLACPAMSPRRRTRCPIHSPRFGWLRLGQPPRRAAARSAVPGSWGCPSGVPAPTVLPGWPPTPGRVGSTAGVERRPSDEAHGRPSADAALRLVRPEVGVVAADRPAASAGLRPLAGAAGRPPAGKARAVVRRPVDAVALRVRAVVVRWRVDAVAPRARAVVRWRVDAEAPRVRVAAGRAAPARSREVPDERVSPEGLEPALRRRCWAGWVRRVRVPLEGFAGVWPAVAAEPRVRRRPTGHQRRAASRPGSPGTASGRTAPTGRRTRSPPRPGTDWAPAVSRAARSALTQTGRGSRGRRAPPDGAPRARRARRSRRGCSCGGPRAGCPAPPLPQRARRRARASPGRSAPSAARPPRTPPPAPGGRRAGRPPPGAAVPAGARCAAPRGGRRRTAGERIRRPPRAAAGRR